MKRTVSTRRQGSAFLTVLIVMVVISIGLGGVMSYATNQTHVVRRICDRIRAKSFAEAGANEAYNLLKTNFDACVTDVPFPLSSYRGGTFDATVTKITSNMAVISCVGSCRTATAKAVLDIRNFGVDTNGTAGSGGTAGGGDTSAFGYSIVSGGKMTWSGNGDMDVGGSKIHGNGQYKMVGTRNVIGDVTSATKVWLTGSTTISGTAAAPDVDVPGGSVTEGSTEETVANVTIPNVDLTPYFNSAQGNGQVYNGDQHWSGAGDITIPGGIMWINGDFQYSGSGNIIGCIIATGSIKFTGAGGQVKVANYPSMVSRDSYIDISGSGDFHGLMLAQNGNFSKSGNGVVVGNIMCRGDFDGSGGWDLMTYEDSTPIPPGGGTPGTPATPGSTADRVGVTAWQD